MFYKAENTGAWTDDGKFKVQFLFRNATLYNVILRIARNFLETRENVKISTHPFYHTNLDWFSWGCSKKKFFWRTKFKITFFCSSVRQPHNHISWATSMPFISINRTNPRTNLWNFKNWRFWKMAILKNRPFWIFFSKKNIFFLLYSHENQSKFVW